MPPKSTKPKVQPATHKTTVNTRSRTKESASQHVSEGRAPRIDLRTVKPKQNSGQHLKRPASPAVSLKSKKVKSTSTQSVRPPKLPIILSDSDTSDHEKTHTHSDALTGGNESDELDGMGAVELKRRLLAEHALWGTHEPSSAADAAEGPGDDHEDTSVNEPAAVDMNAYDAADNTLHMDIDEDGDLEWYMGEDFDPNDGDNADTEPAINEEDDEENDEVESSGIQVLQKSKSRADARHAEVPTWDSTPLKPCRPKNLISNKYIKAHKRHRNSVVGDDAVLHATHTRHRNKGWHESAHYVPPFPGRVYIKLTDQPSNLQTTIRSSIQEVVGDTLFKDAFPSLDDTYKPFRKVLHATAQQLKYSHLAHRFTKDPDFGKQVARLIAQRLADIHGKLKNMANDKVPAIYGLEKLNYDECRKCVHDLMKQTSYIYARKLTGEIDGGKPFQHPAIISLLRDGIFQAKRKPLIADHVHRFKSTVTDGIGKNEFEIPAAMLALIATMVYACLIDWQTGERNSRSDFSADFLADVYKDHIEFLGNILDGSKAKYHRMMHNIYTIAATRSKGSLPASNNAIGLLNFDEMEE
ncbi:hypothetical protein BDQ17DRAFT_1429433 [Cyathus striatus]|nr:hypothetical protein BDQ17DRAFT_1429433 [Cyathus striatus]